MAEHWTPEQKKFLQEAYLKYEYEQIGEEIGKTGKAVQIKVSRMGLGGRKRKQVKAGKMERPPAVYNNTGHQTVLNKYANQ